MTSQIGIIRNRFRRWLSATSAGSVCLLWIILPGASSFIRSASQLPAAEPVDARPEPPAPDVHSALTDSATPLRDRTLQERLRRIQSKIDQGEFNQATNDIRETLTKPGTGLLLTNESPGSQQLYRSFHERIEQLLRELPDESLSTYRSLVEPLARSRFETAVRQADVDRLRQLVLSFPLTASSTDALHFLLARHLDRHEPAAASSVARRLLRQPDLSEEQRRKVLEIIARCLSQPLQPTPRTAVVKAEAERATLVRQQIPPQATGDIDACLPLRAHVFPALENPLWQVHSGLNDETTSLTSHALHEHFEQSIPVLPQTQPLVINGIVVRRSPIQISAHHLDSGKLLWSVESESDSGQTASRLTMNLSLQELMAQRLARSIQLDSLQSRVSSDGKRIYTVESGISSPAFIAGSTTTMSNGLISSDRTSSRVVARDVHSGQIVWNLTAAAFSEAQLQSSESRSADACFCGLPIPIDRQMVGLVQIGELIRLYSVDQRTGQINWTLDVAEAARNSPSDADWRSQDCRVALIDGVVVCPTGAGLLAGVELATRSVIWCRRFSRADAPLDVMRLPFAPARPQRPWWQGWRNFALLAASKSSDSDGAGATTVLSESILIAAGPDADGIHAVDPYSGETVWHQTVDDPVELLTIDDQVVVVSRHHAAAIDAGSGSPLWRKPCPEPIGTGYQIRAAGDDTNGSVYHVFPVRGGSLVALSLSDGSLLESVDRLESLNGCLTSIDGKVISLTPDRMTVWPLLSENWTRGDSPKPSAQSPPAHPSVIDVASMERSSGLFERSAARLRSAGDVEGTAAALRKTLAAWLETGKPPSAGIPAILSEYENLVGEKSISSLISARHAAARAAVASGDPVLALDFYAKLQVLNPSGEPRFLKPEPLRSVRHDRLIQGELIDLLQDENEVTVRRLTDRYHAMATLAASSHDPFALQRFARAWYGLPMTATYHLDERSQIGLRFSQKLLCLLALQDSTDPEISGEASRRLIELYESRSYSRDAVAVRREMQVNHGSTSESDSSDKPVVSPWPEGSVTVTEHPEQNLDTTFVPVPIESRPGALFDRLNVAINPRSSRNETVVRFYGDGISGYWQTVLQTSTSPLKSVGSLHRGWGIGHFLVLQLGAELFGISPFDGSGEPRAQRLWSIDMAEGNRQEDHQYTVAVPGFTMEKLTMLDAFVRPLVNVGPVRADYLCYQTRGKLVCLDTSTGQRLWQRYELPRHAACNGDGQHVYLVESESDRVTVLRAIDGATEFSFNLSQATGFRGTILQLLGGHVLTGRRSADSDRHPDQLKISEVAAIDLKTGRIAWSTPIDENATVFAIGSQWLGIISARGELVVLNNETGKQIASANVQRPNQIRAAYVSTDAISHIIALSESAPSKFLNGRLGDSNLRNPSVTGQLITLNALTGDLQWQRSVEGIRFLLDQPRNAPCLILSYQRARRPDNSTMDSVLHILDRRTGEDILNRRSSGTAFDFTIEPHADQNRLSIRMARKSIRLTFAPQSTP